MEISAEQFARIEQHLPRQRGNVSHEDLNVINAILFVAENGCKWRALPKRFGNWHTIYTRMNRWAKAGVLDRLFAQLQREQLIRIKIEAVSLDSTIMKVHPDGSHRQIAAVGAKEFIWWSARDPRAHRRPVRVRGRRLRRIEHSRQQTL